MTDRRDTPLPAAETDARIYFAAERNLLAWVRTGLAMMGFGFVVARFGLFLRELAAIRADAAPEPTVASLWVGTALIGFGIAVNLYAALHYKQLIDRLNRGQTLHFHGVALASVTAVLLAVLGVVIAIYLALSA